MNQALCWYIARNTVQILQEILLELEQWSAGWRSKQESPVILIKFSPLQFAFNQSLLFILCQEVQLKTKRNTVCRIIEIENWSSGEQDEEVKRRPAAVTCHSYLDIPVCPNMFSPSQFAHNQSIPRALLMFCKKTIELKILQEILLTKKKEI